MPKPFSVVIEVEEIAFGAVVRKLNSIPGIARIHLNLGDTPKASAPRKANGQGHALGKNKEGIRALVMATMRKCGGKLTSKQIGNLAVAHGGTRSGAASVMTKAKHDKLVDNPQMGVWKLTAKGKADTSAAKAE